MLGVSIVLGIAYILLMGKVEAKIEQIRRITNELTIDVDSKDDNDQGDILRCDGEYYCVSLCIGILCR